MSEIPEITGPSPEDVFAFLNDVGMQQVIAAGYTAEDLQRFQDGEVDARSAAAFKIFSNEALPDDDQVDKFFENYEER